MIAPFRWLGGAQAGVDPRLACKAYAARVLTPGAVVASLCLLQPPAPMEGAPIRREPAPVLQGTLIADTVFDDGDDDFEDLMN